MTLSEGNDCFTVFSVDPTLLRSSYFGTKTERLFSNVNKAEPCPAVHFDDPEFPVTNPTLVVYFI